MRAKLYVFKEQMEIRLIDDTVCTPEDGEDKASFIERVKGIVTIDYLDDEFECIEIDAAVVAMNDDATLASALASATGLQKGLIESVLADRKSGKAKPKREKVEAHSIEEAKATPEYQAAEANVGKYVKFSPFKSEEVYEGKIAGIALNKTATIIYYTVVEASGKRRCCGFLNPSLEFIDAPAVTVEEVKKVKKTKKEKVVVSAEVDDLMGVAGDVNGADLDTAGGDELM
jgi:hypothetical protein